MRNFDKPKRASDPFVQGFWLGLIFGTIGALIMLGRQGRPENTL